MDRVRFEARDASATGIMIRVIIDGCATGWRLIGGEDGQRIIAGMAETGVWQPHDSAFTFRLARPAYPNPEAIEGTADPSLCWWLRPTNEGD